MRALQLVLKIIALTIVYWAIVTICGGLIVYGTEFWRFRPRGDLITALIYFYLCRRVVRSHWSKYGEPAKKEDESQKLHLKDVRRR